MYSVFFILRFCYNKNVSKNKPRKTSKSYRKPKIAETISIVTHQLKSPLSVIKSYLEALISGDCGEVNSLQREYLSDALENVERMKRNIDDLLIIQRVEEGKLKIERNPVSLDKITSDVLKNFFYWAKASNCQIFFKKSKKLPLVLGDPQAIRGVIENLVANAIKYTQEKGKIVISIVPSKTNEKIIFSCKDNGIGIPEKDFKKIFTKFYRSDRAMELDPLGAGLGLYINKAIVTLCGGEIWFSRNKDAGMTFYFSLPVAKPR